MSDLLPTRDEKYHLLPNDNESESDSSDFELPPLKRRSLSQVLCSRWTIFLLFIFLFCASVTGNIFFLLKQNGKAPTGGGFAGLVRNVPTPIYSSTEYGPAIGTQAERDARWAAIDISEGIIAIPDHIALKHGLPLSERFPWDQTQGVYLLGGHHQVHCLKKVYEFVTISHQGGTPKLSYEHIVHCLDNMLQDAWCHADDTPWMQLPPDPYRQNYDLYQTRQCKSFEKLQTWAKQYNACYQNENILDAEGNPTEDPFEHFKYCPEGSPYIPLMEKFFKQKAMGINATEAYELLHHIS